MDLLRDLERRTGPSIEFAAGRAPKPERPLAGPEDFANAKLRGLYYNDMATRSRLLELGSTVVDTNIRRAVTQKGVRVTVTSSV